MLGCSGIARNQPSFSRHCSAASIWLSLLRMSVQVNLPDGLAAAIDHVADDRSAFVTEAVRRMLRGGVVPRVSEETARINEFADELNREAEDVLEYQVLR